MRARSRELGLKYGPINFKKAHEKDRYISCKDCDDLDCFVRNKFKKNYIQAGFGYAIKNNCNIIIKIKIMLII